MHIHTHIYVIYTYIYVIYIPMLMRTRSSGSSRAERTSAGIDACDILHGSEINEFTEPNDTVILNNLVVVTTCSDSFKLPVKKRITQPPPLACDECMSQSG